MIVADYADDFKKVVRIEKKVYYAGNTSYSVHKIDKNGQNVYTVAEGLRTYQQAFDIALQIFQNTLKEIVDVTLEDKS